MIKGYSQVITPKLAKAWLERNTNNYRKLSEQIVEAYASDMANDLWEENGESIVFDEDGVLKDGQHRLAAIIKADKPITMFVIEGVSRDVTTWDDGKIRSTKERAMASGITVDNSEIGAATLIVNGFTKHKSSKSLVVNFLEENGELLHKARLMSTHGDRHGFMKKAPCIAALYCAMKLKLMDDEQLDAFCSIANSGMPYKDYITDAPLMLKKMVHEGIKAEDGHVIVSTGAIRKPLFELTWLALSDFKDGQKVSRRYKPLEGKCSGSLILETVQKLDKINRRAKTA